MEQQDNSHSGLQLVLGHSSVMETLCVSACLVIFQLMENLLPILISISSGYIDSQPLKSLSSDASSDTCLLVGSAGNSKAG